MIQAQVVQWLCVAQALAAAPGPAPVPDRHIPPSVLMELRSLESQFDMALGRDCAPERCASKGCSYREHVVVDRSKGSSLPGLPPAEGGLQNAPQEYLTQAHCEFAHEKAIPLRDVQALAKRLEQRLSRSWLVVTVGRQILEPVPLALSLSPPERPAVEPPKPPAAPPPGPAEWSGSVALRELWLALLPHFSWMIAVLLLTSAALALIWGVRRVGKETLEERALLAELSQPTGETAASLPEPAEASDSIKALPEGDESHRFVEEQQRLWSVRVAQSDLGQPSSPLAGLLRDWLRDGQFALLAKALFSFGDRLAQAFASDPELAEQKVAFASFLRQVDRDALPSDTEFFTLLSRHAISASLLAQTDAETYQSLRDEFGAVGLASLLGRLPSRSAALLYAMVPVEAQPAVADSLAQPLRARLVRELLRSNRMSHEERQHLFDVLDAAREGRPISTPPAAPGHLIEDRGRTFDAANVVSLLLERMEPQARAAALQEVLESEAIQDWHLDIFHGEMLQKLSESELADVLLGADVQSVAMWLGTQGRDFRARLLDRLPATLQSALGHLAHLPAARQDELVRNARRSLAAGLRGLVKTGRRTLEALWGS